LPGHRWNVIERDGNITYVNDAYNANPTSMEVSLKTFAKMECKGRKIAVLGDMFELGEKCGELHSRVGEVADVLPIDFVFTVGELSRSIFDRVGEGKRMHFETVEDAREYLADFLKSGDAVLLKASRGMRLENLLK
jgi:UDP-N-acetylmuramoyl-tripeptide--D-alanyl-D-alanine ligase